MNKLVYLIACVVCIVIPIIAVLYGIWDSHQPKTGPVGDGKTHITIIQLIPIISTFLLGIINLPRAIIRYKIQIESKSGGK
jgi:hypothetical protein